MEEAMKRRRVPAFGSWNQCERFSAGAQYAGQACQAGPPQGGAGFRGGCVGGGGHLYPPHLPYPYYWQDSGDDLFQVPVLPPVVVAAYPRKVKKEKTAEKPLKRRKQQKAEEETPQQPEQRNKQGKVCGSGAAVRQPPRQARAAMAVDEDLYKIPPKLLCEKSKRKKMAMSDFWSRCLGLSCVP